MPYPDGYTRHGAPDEGRGPSDLPEDHPFRDWSEGELSKLVKSLEATRHGILALNVNVMGVTDSDIRGHLGGYLVEMIDYLDVLDSRLTAA